MNRLAGDLATAAGMLTEAVSSTASIAVEWLLDNEYLVLRAAAQVHVDLPSGFYRLLPKVAHSERELTRVELIAREVMQASNDFIDIQQIQRFVRSFQSVAALDNGEIWALPAFLRLVIVEKIVGMAHSAAGPDPGHGVNENMAAAVGSIRVLDNTDWAAFFESVSIVDRVLRRDPLGAYRRLDFATRDRYRHAVEELARWSGLSEANVARLLLDFIRESGVSLGALLIGDERRMFEGRLACNVPPVVRLRRLARRNAGRAYFALVAGCSAGALALVLLPLLSTGAPFAATLTMLAVLLALVPATSIGIPLANDIATRVVKPQRLPRLDFSEGIPDDARTLVAIPALLTDAEEIHDLIAQMELNFRGNRSSNLSFALLTDLTDADEPELPDDARLLRLAAQGIRDLNARHRAVDRFEPFLLLTRKRRWNEAERRWMGWERKRGKLEELNDLLLGRGDPDLHVVEGDPLRFTDVRYVLTLDADTFLPEGEAAQLIGTLAHPLHEVRFDARGRVTAGYTLLQPRVDTLADSDRPTWFSRMYQAHDGFDLYSHTASDVYQDLFGEGIFAGKGLYDVRAFERSLRERVPENSLLSHDLFEGAHGRAALVSDVSVIEDYPSHPLAFMSRAHRWVRGDWQLLPWLLPRVPVRGGRARNVLSALDRWKIADNLRRSLLAASLVPLVVIGWWWLPGSWWWTAVPFIVFLTPVLVPTVLRVQPPLWRGAVFRTPLLQTMWGIARALTSVVFLPWQALIELDAIGRTLYRLGVSRQRLLQWRPAAATARALTRPQGAWLRPIVWAHAYVVPVAIGVGTFLLGAPWGPVISLLALWLIAPPLAIALGRRVRTTPKRLTDEARAGLLRLARRTWGYFDLHISAEDHWLPPDNIQLHPIADIARRTSPTNIGLGMLSQLVGSDLGFMPASRLAATLENTLDTLDRLERHRGHLLNWYDTRQLRPLAPRYVSSVDSGNLAACAIVISQALADLPSSPILRAAHADGLVSALEILAETLESFHGVEALRKGALPAAVRRLAVEMHEAREDPALFAERLESLQRIGLPTIETDVARALEGGRSGRTTGSLGAVREWVRGVDRQVMAVHAELEALVPWLGALRDAPALYADEPTPWSAFVAAAPLAPSLEDVPDVCVTLLRCLDDLDAWVAGASAEPGGVALAWNDALRSSLHAARQHAEALLSELESVRERLDDFVSGMDFGFLYDHARHLLRVGYHVDGASLDRSYYDLYASEARIASFIAIAKGDIPPKHWTRLGRPFARRNGDTMLLSWSGTMFEYLMPSLFMHTPPGSLADVACRRAVATQVRFGARHRMPWGISESGFHQTDSRKRYRYRAFGVPELAVRFDPSDRLVATPYASMLALSMEPQRVWTNLLHFSTMGALGPLGLYEAADFGAGTLPEPQLVRSFMAHHQGMILAALDNYLAESILVKRFHRDPRVAAFEFLLREAAPGRVRTQPPRALGRPETAAKPVAPPTLGAWNVDPRAHPAPTTVVSNGGLSSLITACGAGGMRWRDREVLRWRPDPTAQEWGTWIYVRDVESERLWSATHAPTWVEPDRYEVVFGAHAVDFQREDEGIGMRTTVTVAPHGDVEIRRITLVNESQHRRVLELTSFAQVSLADPGEDRRHQAFSKLFVEGRYASRSGAILYERRPRGEESPSYLVHTVATADPEDRPVAWSLDREAFLGRGGSMRAPRGARAPSAREQPDRVWAPLDPIVSLTVRVELAPGSEASIAFLTTVADAPGTALAMADAYRSPERALFATQQARDRERALLQDLSTRGDLVPVFQRLLGAIVFPFHTARADPATRAMTTGPYQEALWASGISGDLPVVVIEAHGETDPLLEELVKAHAYLDRHGVQFDLVAVSRHEDGYAQPVLGRLSRLLADLGLSDRLEQRGGVHYISFGRMAEGALAALRSAAAVTLVADGRPLAAHLHALEHPQVQAPRFVPVPASAPEQPEIEPVARPAGLLYDNGFGGFTEDGTEYVVHLEPGRTTPAPWSNILAHESFGCLVSESGGGYTWSGNSGEQRLTTWRNDPLSDAPSETLYLRDEETGYIWSPTPAPAAAAAAYQVVHTAGLTSFLHRSHGLDQRTEIYTPPGEAAKVVDVTLSNEWNRPRRITATYLTEWVLGVHRWWTGPHLMSEIMRPEHALLARNPFSPSTRDMIGFLAASEPIHGFTCDRHEFLGPEGDRTRPAGLMQIGLQGRIGAGLDPCGALQIHVDLAPGQTRTIRFLVGAARSVDEVRQTLERLRDPAESAVAAAGAVDRWNDLLGRVTVKTPEPDVDVLLNRWLLYQTVACRLWGRSALYQSSGAIGFRDQLQDSLALRLHAPHLTRHQILEAARHQFTEGDVLHWWHPEGERGVRTRCSDDLLWLPFAVAEYVDATGDDGLLDEPVPFLVGPQLRPGELERYDHFPAGGSASVYEHCVAALERAEGRSPRGLPFIGTGDWNDALNHVGVEGRGESVWLAWFLQIVQERFALIAESRGDASRVESLRANAEALRRSVEEHCWDGAWYQRATFDDGTPIGTASAKEGQIDSLTQSWAVLSGRAEPERVRTAMGSVLDRLVNHRDRLVLLLTPPFHETEHDPGYIRSYPPGVRENGGQYTHAAAWVGLAFTAMGEGDRAMDIFGLLSPVRHAHDRESSELYRVEPYVVAGDVYGARPHVGRGGWTWYTGSAAWTYRLGIEGILGLRPRRGELEIAPCIPRHWKEYEARIRVGDATSYRIVVRNPHGAETGVESVTLDGESLADAVVPLADDGIDHEVEVVLGEPRQPARDMGDSRRPPPHAQVGSVEDED